MKCPKCGCEISSPTPQQIEAYRLVYLVKMKQESAAIRMGISQSGIAKLLERLAVLRPELFVGRGRIIPYDPSMDGDITERF